MDGGIGEALLITAAIGAVGSASSQYSASRSKEHTLDLEAKQLKLQTIQKQVANYDQLQKVLDAQTAMASVRGFTMNSPSFNAIQRNTVNVGSKYFKKIDTEYELGMINIKNEKNAVKQSLFAQLFGDVTSLAMGGLNAYNSMPSKGG